MMSSYLRLTEQNEQRMREIMAYADDNPALIERVKNSTGRVNRSNVFNALVAEFHYLFYSARQILLNANESCWVRVSLLTNKSYAVSIT